VDEPALRKLVDWQIESGIHGLVPCGTTGESATLDYDEHERVIEVVIEQAKGRVPVVAGTGSNSTWEAIKLTKHAKEAGATASLQITPYYNRPTQEGMYRHFEEVARAVDIPIIIYNVPSRTGVNLAPETMGRLARIDTVIGLKDAAGSITQTLDTLDACHGEISILTGDDFMYASMLAVGARGGICVISNLVPGPFAELFKAWDRGDAQRAGQIQRRYHALNKCMYLETNPIPVKWAAHIMGLCSGEIRLPLVPLADGLRPKLEKAMRDLELC
jgi:4-hydroxy-tetrahydrodipicolinate synthase